MKCEYEHRLEPRSVLYICTDNLNKIADCPHKKYYEGSQVTHCLRERREQDETHWFHREPLK